MYWLLGRNSELSVHNNLTLHKQVIRPVWSYGIQRCASESNIQVIQRYQNKVLKCIVNAPGTFEIVTFIVISESRRLQIS
jgi:hypothetical protein